MDLRPLGVIPPLSMIPPLDNLEPLPALLIYPARVATPPLLLEDDRWSHYDSLVAALVEKVQAEDQRMRRLLPAAPRGMHWEVELQSMEPTYNFPMNRADQVVRLVYRLKENDGRQ